MFTNGMKHGKASGDLRRGSDYATWFESAKQFSKSPIPPRICVLPSRGICGGWPRRNCPLEFWNTRRRVYSPAAQPTRGDRAAAAALRSFTSGQAIQQQDEKAYRADRVEHRKEPAEFWVACQRAARVNPGHELLQTGLGDDSLDVVQALLQSG